MTCDENLFPPLNPVAPLQTILAPRTGSSIDLESFSTVLRNFGGEVLPSKDLSYRDARDQYELAIENVIHADVLVLFQFFTDNQGKVLAFVNNLGEKINAKLTSDVKADLIGGNNDDEDNCPWLDSALYQMKLNCEVWVGAI